MKRLLLGLLLSLFVTLLCLAAAELGLRLVFPDRVEQPADLATLAFEFDPRYGVALKPNVEKRFPQGDREITWRTNSRRYRGPELRSSDLRVVVYGDSNVLARFTPLARTFPAQLERELAGRSGRDVEVVNAGVVGMGPDQSVLRFEAEADELRPDVVVLHVFADNDYGDLVRNRLFDLVGDRLEPSPYAPTPDQMLTEGTARSGADALLLVQALVRLADPYPHATLLAREWAVYRAGAPRRFSHFADHYDSDVALEPGGDAARAKRRLLSAVLARGGRAAASREIGFVVLVQPSSRDLTTNLSPNHTDFASSAAYQRTNLSSFAEQAARSQGLHVVNLYDAFAANDPPKLYFRGGNNFHWNETGQALAAHELASYLALHLL